MVLPDCAAGAAAAAAFHNTATQVVGHASGRPWLLGRWNTAAMTVATAGRVRVAVAGVCGASEAAITLAAQRIGSVADLDSPGLRWSGSYQLLASYDGWVRAQGTASGMRRIFYTRIGDAVIGSDRSDVLAEAVGAAISEDVLALRLMEPFVPHPLTERSVWRGVHAVPSGSWLRLGTDGAAQEVQWWSPPAPQVPLASGAPRLAEALSDAVTVRTRDGGTVSADLSGGLDSTPLCFLAARGPACLIAFTRAGTDAGHDDVAWARRAAAHLSDVTHEVVEPATQPSWWADLPRTGEGMDEPTLGARNWAQYRRAAGWLAGYGSRVHLSGEGGDQVLLATPGFLHDTLRSHPSTGIAYLRAAAARARWLPLAVMRAAADRSSYSRWLASTAGDLAPARLRSRTPDLGWQYRPSVPTWSTPAATATVRSQLLAVAQTAQPLAPTRGQHGTLISIRGCVAICRNLSRVTAEAGVPTHYPFYDDRVVEACLAVRLHERTTPFAYKPLMAAAMRGIVPDELLTRRTKGEFTAEMHAGLRAQRDILAEITDAPMLARLGLIDADAFRRATLGPYHAHVSLAQLENCLALEAWLRAHADHACPTSVRQT